MSWMKREALRKAKETRSQNRNSSGPRPGPFGGILEGSDLIEVAHHVDPDDKTSSVQKRNRSKRAFPFKEEERCDQSKRHRSTLLPLKEPSHIAR